MYCVFCFGYYLYSVHTLLYTVLCWFLPPLGLVIATFGPNFSFLLLHLLYTEVYSQTSAPAVLGWYCIYVLFMALNGKIHQNYSSIFH